ncbi:MAG: PhzF family phenazine biosynthesis protein [Chitinophagaceae bacterium]|nr:PhzF family phenazine biosynthesis protein [Chitinophagaceae bacterium]
MENNKKIQVHIINAFVDENKGGNPAGVVLNADLLTNLQKQYVAQQVGISEIAFVSSSTIADFKLDFFTPIRQIAHCGHATIGAFSYMVQSGLIQKKNSSKETIDGTRSILLKEDLAFMQQKPPLYHQINEHSEDILNALGLNHDDLMPHTDLSIVNTGNSFALIPVINQDILKKIKPYYQKIHLISEKFDLVGFYVFSTNEAYAGIDATTRMFAPRYGINEEAGTGMAAGPLASYLYDLLGIQKQSFTIQQGAFMNPSSPSKIFVDLTIEEGKITNIMAGGKGLYIKTIEADIPQV